MQNVKVNKKELLEVVIKNAANHRKAFEDAFDGYRKESILVLEQNLKQLRSKKKVRVFFAEQPPEDHTDDYKQIINMLEMSVEDTVELSYSEFRQYVEDNWSWKQVWTASNMKYISK